MKNTFLKPFIVTAFLISSACSKEGAKKTEDASPKTDYSIIGKWNASVRTINTSADGKLLGKADVMKDISWEFKTDGFLYIINGGSTDKISYRIVGNNKVSLNFNSSNTTMNLTKSNTGLSLNSSSKMTDGSLLNEIIDLKQN